MENWVSLDMFYTVKVKKAAVFAVLLVCILAVAAVPVLSRSVSADTSPAGSASGTKQEDFIKWVDFGIPSDLMKTVGDLDIETYEDPARDHLDWVEVLAYLGAKYGGDFSLYRRADLDALLERAAAGETVEALAKDMKYFGYYREAYGAVLGGLLGEYETETENGWEARYGWKAYSPIAKTFPYSDYDDFGVGRSYGYQRKHLGHDMMAQVGTPVIAVESGVVEAMGWNQYGGWRIGIRSFDGLRYHYYAHLRKDRPYAEGLQEGQTVMAGDVIGYVGRTGYSTTENTNNIDTSHLHYGLQLVFDESQKEGMTEIWIDVYGLCNLLRGRQSEVVRNDETKEWTRTGSFREEIPEDHFVPPAKEEDGASPAS